jgi:HSP20 family protein
LSEVTTTDKEVKIVVEVPGVSKEQIRINAYDNKVEINSKDPKRK